MQFGAGGELTLQLCEGGWTALDVACAAELLTVVHHVRDDALAAIVRQGLRVWLLRAVSLVEPGCILRSSACRHPMGALEAADLIELDALVADLF